MTILEVFRYYKTKMTHSQIFSPLNNIEVHINFFILGYKKNTKLRIHRKRVTVLSEKRVSMGNCTVYIYRLATNNK